MAEDRQDELMHAMLECTRGYSISEILGALNAMVAGLIANAPTEALRELALKKFVTQLLIVSNVIQEIDNDRPRIN